MLKRDVSMRKSLLSLVFGGLRMPIAVVKRQLWRKRKGDSRGEHSVRRQQRVNLCHAVENECIRKTVEIVSCFFFFPCLSFVIIKYSCAWRGHTHTHSSARTVRNRVLDGRLSFHHRIKIIFCTRKQPHHKIK